MVTTFATRLNIKKFCILPTAFIYMFCVNLRTIVIIFLHSIAWLVFVTGMDCVYCVV